MISVDRQDDFCLYETAMSELDIPAHPTVEQFCDLYETVTSGYDDYRHNFDGLQALRDWCDQEWPSLPHILEVGLAVEQLDVRGVVWLCEERGHEWDNVRGTLAGKNTSFLFERLPEVDDWFGLQSFLKENDWVVKYRQVRKFLGGGKAQGRSIGALTNRFGAVLLKDDGTPASRYGSCVDGRYVKV